MWLGLWVYRTFFKASLDRLELILFIDRMGRNGRGYDEASARRYLETCR